MAIQDPLNPNASPGQVTTGTRNVNNIPVYLICGAILTFLLVMVKVGYDRSEQQNQNADVPLEKPGSSVMFAQSIAGDAQGLIPPQPSASTTPVLIATQGNLDAPPTPGGLSAPMSQPAITPNTPMAPPPDDQTIQFQNIKNQQFVEAVRSKTSVGSGSYRGSGMGASGAANPTREQMLAQLSDVQRRIQQESKNTGGTYESAVAQAQKALSAAGVSGSSGRPGVPGVPGGAGLFQTSSSNKNSYAQYSGNGQGDRWKLDSQPEKPRTPFELRAGFVIPATLVSGINSELPGQIIGQVSQDVWDTPTGKYLLIPQGSRLVGTYSSDVSYGQARVLVAWQRILFPDGKSFDIGSMPGADGAGYSGFKDQVNNHYMRIFASALLMSGVTAGITYSQRDNQNPAGINQNSASGALSEALGQQLGQVTAQMIAKNMNISPTLEIRPGFRFNVMVTKDLTLPSPYQAEY
ncbi:MAG: TrbI/VirB10 family protein [Limnobacter sp.]|jgi:type IV secretory pathway VirB10-like protein